MVLAAVPCRMHKRSYAEIFLVRFVSESFACVCVPMCDVRVVRSDVGDIAAARMPDCAASSSQQGAAAVAAVVFVAVVSVGVRCRCRIRRCCCCCCAAAIAFGTM